MKPPASSLERSSRSVASLVSRCTCSPIVSRNSLRSASVRPPSVSSSRYPPRAVSGVRSSCEAFAMNSPRARSSASSRTRISSSERASSPISSRLLSTIGSSNEPCAMRSAAARSRARRRASGSAASAPASSATPKASAPPKTSRRSTAWTCSWMSRNGACTSTTPSTPWLETLNVSTAVRPRRARSRRSRRRGAGWRSPPRARAPCGRARRPGRSRPPGAGVTPLSVKTVIRATPSVARRR